MDSKRSRVRIERVAADEAGRRIDNFLLARLKDMPKSLVYKLLRSGQVRVNGGRIKPAYRLVAEDEVRIPPLAPTPDANEPATIPRRLLDELAAAVLYEDDAFLILDKPAGLASHAGSGLRYGLVEAARRLRPEIPRLDLGHRLDRDTSGCIVLCKGLAALAAFHAALRGGGVDKRYCALLRGRLDPALSRIDAALAIVRDPGGERISAAARDGRAADTRIEARRPAGKHTLAEIRLVTGRMHQIRAHALAIGHPVAGDPRYGDPDFNEAMAALGLHRLFLHAGQVAFSADGRAVCARAPLPAPLAAVLARLEA